MKLYLFDIDGTLIHTFKAGQKAADRAFEQVFGVKNAMEGIRTDGLTDPLILAMMFEKTFKRRFTHSEALGFYSSYVSYLDDELSKMETITVLPGVTELLKKISSVPGCALALGTGNIEQGAWVKLRYAGLDSYFKTGGFGSDSEKRNELIISGIEKAGNTLNGKVSFKEIYVIGDTPHDINHGRAAGGITVAVATGNYTLNELEEHNPDFLLEDLSKSETDTALGLI